MATAFPYNKTTPVNSDGFAFNTPQLRTAILNDSGITTTLDFIRGIGKEDIIVNFVTDPSGPEITALNAVVAAHVPLDASPRLAIGFNSNELVFRPGSPIFEDGPTFFSDWDDLIARSAEFGGSHRRRILIDDTFVSPVEIPAGSYDLEDTVMEGVSTVTRANVSILNGAIFTNGPSQIVRLDITNLSNSAPMSIGQDAVNTWVESTIQCVNSPLISYSGSINGSLIVSGLTVVSNSGSPCIEIADVNAQLLLLVGSVDLLGSDTLSDVGGAKEILIAAFGDSSIDSNQPNLSNTLISSEADSSLNPVVQANAVSFDPSATDLLSTNLQGAIEELSATGETGEFGPTGATGATGETGETGPTGATGPAGSVVNSFNYTFRTSTASTPTSGRIQYDNAVPALVTQVYANELDALGINRSPFYGQLEVGDNLFTVANDLFDGQIWEITGISQLLDVWTFDVNLVNSLGLLGQNEAIQVAVVFEGDAGPTGPTGAIGPTGLTGATGETGVTGADAIPGVEFASSEPISSTNSTTPVNKVTLTTSNLPAGTYRIAWYYEWRYDNVTRDFIARVQLDGTTNLGNHRQEPKDAGGNQKYPAAGFAIVNLTAGVHTVTIDYGAQNAADNAFIGKARIELFEVTT